MSSEQTTCRGGVPTASRSGASPSRTCLHPRLPRARGLGSGPGSPSPAQPGGAWGWKWLAGEGLRARTVGVLRSAGRAPSLAGRSPRLHLLGLAPPSPESGRGPGAGGQGAGVVSDTRRFFPETSTPAFPAGETSTPESWPGGRGCRNAVRDGRGLAPPPAPPAGPKQEEPSGLPAGRPLADPLGPVLRPALSPCPLPSARRRRR